MEEKNSDMWKSESTKIFVKESPLNTFLRSTFLGAPYFQVDHSVYVWRGRIFILLAEVSKEYFVIRTEKIGLIEETWEGKCVQSHNISNFVNQTTLKQYGLYKENESLWKLFPRIA